MGILKKIWNFIWHDNSVWSWLVNVILAFVLVKFVIYPGLGFLLHTTHPVVAVMSSSMEHNGDFNTWWEEKGRWYEDNNLNIEDIKKWSFKNGFNKGDIMVLKGVKFENIEVGEVVVYNANRAEPIIHRVVKKERDYLQTKGDNNNGLIDFEERVEGKQIIGKAVFRLPLLGWVKIGFVNFQNRTRVCLGKYFMQ